MVQDLDLVAEAVKPPRGQPRPPQGFASESGFSRPAGDRRYD
jgi:hypothetical protein